MKKSTPYLLLVPALLFTVFVLVYPLMQNLINSFSNVSMITGRSGWAGFRNYQQIFGDALFWSSFRNTSVYAVVGTLLALVIGLGFALLLNLKLGKITTIMGCLYTVPWVISPVVAGFAWKWLLNDNFGVVNYWLSWLGLVKVGTTWLGNPGTALFCVMLARIWQFYPFAMVMFLAGLQSIPQEQYEAAAVDGATMIRRFFHITLPNLRSVTSVMLVLGVIWSFNDFNMVFVMTRGGPMNSSMVLPVLVREFSFVHFDLGKGSALSIIIFALLTSLSFLYLKTAGRGGGVMKKALISGFMIILALLVLLPVLWTISTSLKPLSEVNKYPPQWTCSAMSLQPYSDMFFYLPFSTYTLNSLIVACSSTVLTLLLGSLAAFAFSRFAFAGKQIFLLIFLLSQMLPGASVIIPLFQLLQKAGLYDTYFGLILVHSAVLLPFVIWLLYGFFQTIPREIEDAALIDGCSRMTALWKVILPLALPGIGATALFSFLGSWNEFFFALILTSSDSTRTIPVGIGLFVGEYLDVWNQMAAAAILFSIPPLILFTLTRKTFIKGLVAGACK